MTKTALGANHRRFLRIEITIGTVLGGLLPATLEAALSSTYPADLWEVLEAMLKGTLVPGFGITIIVTLIVRMRIRGGGAPAISWRRADHRWLRYIPDKLIMRAVFNALCAALIVVPVGLGSAFVLNLCPMGRWEFFAFNAVYSAFLGLLVSPPILLAAMTDSSHRVSPASVIRRLQSR